MTKKKKDFFFHFFLWLFLFMLNKRGNFFLKACDFVLSKQIQSMMKRMKSVPTETRASVVPNIVATVSVPVYFPCLTCSFFLVPVLAAMTNLTGPAFNL